MLPKNDQSYIGLSFAAGSRIPKNNGSSVYSAYSSLHYALCPTSASATSINCISMLGCKFLITTQ